MPNNEEHKQNEGPIHLAFLNVLALFESAFNVEGDAFSELFGATWSIWGAVMAHTGF